MTGKEALEDLYYSNLDAFIDIEETNEQVEIIKKELKLLAKYKRAFEILKKMNGINRTLFISAICDVATDEEYELLEELLKS